MEAVVARTQRAELQATAHRSVFDSRLFQQIRGCPDPRFAVGGWTTEENRGVDVQEREGEVDDLTSLLGGVQRTGGQVGSLQQSST